MSSQIVLNFTEETILRRCSATSAFFEAGFRAFYGSEKYSTVLISSSNSIMRPKKEAPKEMCSLSAIRLLKNSGNSMVRFCSLE